MTATTEQQNAALNQAFDEAYAAGNSEDVAAAMQAAYVMGATDRLKQRINRYVRYEVLLRLAFVLATKPIFWMVIAALILPFIFRAEPKTTIHQTPSHVHRTAN